MSYKISLSTEAQHDLTSLPVPVARFCIRQLVSLGEFPTVLSKPSHFPYRTKCQIFPFGCSYNNERWELRALFQYGQDEESIFVIAVCFSKLPPGAESNEDFPEIG